jgi:hypothetical protein
MKRRVSGGGFWNFNYYFFRLLGLVVWLSIAGGGAFPYFLGLEGCGWISRG